MMQEERTKYKLEVTYGTTYDRDIYYIYRKFTANSFMWGSLRLTPISIHLGPRIMQTLLTDVTGLLIAPSSEPPSLICCIHEMKLLTHDLGGQYS